jgi:hypothetical protein
MHIPFANWVLARAVVAQWGLEDYVATNPLISPRTANWKSNGGFTPPADVKTEMLARTTQKQYVFPISVSYTLRMMTPADIRYFGTQNCPPVP